MEAIQLGTQYLPCTFFIFSSLENRIRFLHSNFIGYFIDCWGSISEHRETEGWFHVDAVIAQLCFVVYLEKSEFSLDDSVSVINTEME